MSKANEILSLIEGFSGSERKVFVDYAVEILKKLKAAHEDADEKTLRNSLRKVMSNMALGKDNPNYKNTSKFMPSSFDKKLFDNGENNTYDSLWMSQKDAAHDTVFRQALKKMGK